jgi:hypothetical protein
MEWSGKDSPENTIFALGPHDGNDYIQIYLNEKIGSMGSGMDKHGNFCDILQVVPQNGKKYSLKFVIQHATKTMFEK